MQPNAKPCVITRIDEPQAYFHHIYNSCTGSISCWVNEIYEARVFPSISAARRYAMKNISPAIKPHCRFVTLAPSRKKWYHWSC